ncbi:hypothetical protein FGG08_003342 [Glutinoglossum americanum]|uniref:Mannosyltransferase n=1 Tax=Glutinoglossum americanum TaxID=1670608 RepID=A0A9P8L4T8_9PEZI|nr:hypothetical protein FGG08_003342 [Glutinoglossum americanum]
MTPPPQSYNGVALRGQQRVGHPAETFSSRNILLFIVAFRILNSLSLQTFFQPDEYFQSLEPAWQMAFGKDSGAWITWEWEHQLRSSIHPTIFAGVYYISSTLADLLKVSYHTRVELLLAAPKVTQAAITALGDYYTWKLGERVFEPGSRAAWATWFCSTRTLSNCLEVTLTIIALSLWPWHWSLAATQRDERDEAGLRVPRGGSVAESADELTRGLILALSVLTDRLYYQTWTFPPFRFLYFNIAQSLSIFYGRNDWHYYFSQGLPLLLTTALPFGLLGIWRTLHGGHFIRLQLAVTVLFVTFTLSLISHKEVRFIYPILPALHILTAEALVSTIYPFQHVSTSSLHSHRAPRITQLWKSLLSILLAVNILIALYTTLIHQSGVISVLTYLRKEHGSRNTTTTIGFLMPCHSTPWRSHLIHPSMHAWALTCEPPVNLAPAARAAYLDEADIFYADPDSFLRTRFAPPPPLGEKVRTSAEKKQWPDYIVFFEQLQPVMVGVLRGSGYAECWRGFNSHWHDDWRRKGDVVVWCLREL